MASSCVQVQATAGRYFGYDPVPVRNPPGTAIPETVCGAKHGGLCENQHGHFNLVCSVVKNTFSLLKLKGVGKEQLPVICKMGDGELANDDPFRRFAIVDTHGIGENVVCVGLGGGDVLRLSAGSVGGLAITTLHRLVGKVITALAMMLPLCATTSRMQKSVRALQSGS